MTTRLTVNLTASDCAAADIDSVMRVNGSPRAWYDMVRYTRGHMVQLVRLNDDLTLTVRHVSYDTPVTVEVDTELNPFLYEKLVDWGWIK